MNNPLAGNVYSGKRQQDREQVEMKRVWQICLSGTVIAALSVGSIGCLRVKSDPVVVDVKPIEININIKVQVDRELDNFFDDIDKRDDTIESQ